MKWKWLILPILTALGFAVYAQVVQSRRPYPVENDQLVGVTNVIQTQFDTIYTNEWRRQQKLDVTVAIKATNYFALDTLNVIYLATAGAATTVNVGAAGSGGGRSSTNAVIRWIFPQGMTTLTLTNADGLMLRLSTAELTNSMAMLTNNIMLIGASDLWYVVENNDI